MDGKMLGRVGRVVALVIWATLLYLMALAAQPEGVGAAGFGQGTVPPVTPVAPVKEYRVLLPAISENAFPQEMPALVEGEPSYQVKAVNVDVWMGGAPGSGTEWMRASTLLTFWSWREGGARDAAICWYGVWPDGSGAARCDLYPAGE